MQHGAGSDVITPTIAEENALAGTPGWDTEVSGDETCMGFTTEMNVRAGSALNFKVACTTAFDIDIYRLGHYDDDGARLVESITGTPLVQPAVGTYLGGTDASNWTVNATWNVPEDATHGLYFGYVMETGGDYSMIGPFVVENPRSDSAEILFVTADMTWQAYNHYGTVADRYNGSSLYGTGQVLGVGARSQSVSYDRPMVTRDFTSQTFFFNDEYPAMKWMERCGYDVAYTTDLAVHNDPSILLDRRVVIWAGHQEYWTPEMRDALEASKADSVSQVFWSGNTMLWKTRMSGRRMICYKDSLTLDDDPMSTDLDPVTWTGTWRDQRNPSPDPENSSHGLFFVHNGIAGGVIDVPSDLKTQPFWRNTDVATMVTPSLAMTFDSRGYEWDEVRVAGYAADSTPDGILRLSRVVETSDNVWADDNGSIYDLDGRHQHSIIAYPIDYANPLTKGIVFNFGCNQWPWGLDDHHDRGDTPGSEAVAWLTQQQATMNMFADLGCQAPASPHTGLVATTDQLASYVFPDPDDSYSVWNSNPTFPGGTDNADGPYEMGTIFQPIADVLITGVRIWMHTGAQSITGRKARLWDFDGESVIDDIDIDVAPWSGWKNFFFDTPIPRTGSLDFADTSSWVLASFHTRGYGFLGAALPTPVYSQDGAMLIVPSDNFGDNDPGNGRFNGTPGAFPNGFFNDSFYGVDILYALDL